MHLLNHVFWSLFFPLQLGEPDIKITPTDRTPTVNETVKLNCTASQTADTKLKKIQWFNPQGKAMDVTDKCNAGSSGESRMSCTVTVSAKKEKSVIYTCRAIIVNNYCSTKTIQLNFQGK